MVSDSALTPAEIKATLRAMLAEANRRKTRLTNWLYTFGILAGLVAMGMVYELTSEILGFGGFISTILSFGGAIGTVIPFVQIEESITQRRVLALAEEFRAVFPAETGSYGQALSLLKSAKSESRVEKDLIKALDEDISLGEVPGSLLGGLDDLKAKASGGTGTASKPKPVYNAPSKPQGQAGGVKTARPKPDFMPLDPLGGETPDEGNA